MKTILIRALLPILAVLFATACKDDLNPKIYNQATAANFFKNEADFKAALTPFYTQFSTDWGQIDPGSGVYLFNFNVALNGYDWLTRIMTDESIDFWGNAWGLYTWGPSTLLSTNGQNFYNRIRFVARATDVINQIGTAPVADAIRAKYVAEAKALRAWYMFILYDLYGPLNVKLDPATLTDNEIQPRLTQEAYTAAMEKDLIEAIADLPSMYNGDATNWGRMSKGVARMILFKLYLHDKQWTKAQAVGKDLLGMGYALAPTYKEVFTTPANKEIIYAVPQNAGMQQYWYSLIMPFDASVVCDVKVQPGWYGNAMPWAYYDKYPATDKRLETIGSFYINNQGKRIDRTNGLSGAIPMKYLNYSANNVGFENVIYRYADVLLAMAEITNELVGPTEEAQLYAQQVVNRAGIAIPASAIASKEAFRNFILDERGRELYFEFGNRRSDLIRHGKLISNAVERGNTRAKDYMVLLPIPSDVIIESNGIIEQNPGY
jgi:hypothetical protein